MKFKILLVFGILALIGYTYYYINQQDTTPMTQSCIEKFIITNNDDIVNYLPSVSENIKSVAFTNTITPFEREEVSDNLIGLDKNKKVVVNNKYFSELTLRDATDVDERQMIGSYVDTSTTYTPREIITFLLKSQIVGTYWHLHADLCLTQEDEDDVMYRAHFTGSHEYCTNECISEDYEFAIELNKQTGQLSLLPTQQQ